LKNNHKKEGGQIIELFIAYLTWPNLTGWTLPFNSFFHHLTPLVGEPLQIFKRTVFERTTYPGLLKPWEHSHFLIIENSLFMVDVKEKLGFNVFFNNLNLKLRIVLEFYFFYFSFFGFPVEIIQYNFYSHHFALMWQKKVLVLFLVNVMLINTIIFLKYHLVWITKNTIAIDFVFRLFSKIKWNRISIWIFNEIVNKHFPQKVLSSSWITLKAKYFFTI
jgi:hypothetical protein